MGGLPKNVPAVTKPAETVGDTALAVGKDTFDVDNGDSRKQSEQNNRIVVNDIERVSASKLAIDLLEEDFVEMTPDEMMRYYGADYVPAVPADMKQWPEDCSGIYKRDGGTGEVYWDQDVVNFSSEDFTRTLSLEVAKGAYPLMDYLHFGGTEEKSVINNVEILIGLTGSGYYYAQFMYRDVGFVLCAGGVSLDEFVAILSSLVDGN